MLTLARKLGESILIGDDITVKVVEINKHVIRLGIEAPRQVPILRDEVAQRIASGEYPRRVGG